MAGGLVVTRCGAAEEASKTSTATISDTTTKAGVFFYSFLSRNKHERVPKEPSFMNL